MRERIDLVSNLRGEVEEQMLRDLATPPMTGEIVSHTLTLSNPVMVAHYPRDVFGSILLLASHLAAAVGQPDNVALLHQASYSPSQAFISFHEWHHRDVVCLDRSHHRLHHSRK